MTVTVITFSLRFSDTYIRFPVSFTVLPISDFPTVHSRVLVCPLQMQKDNAANFSLPPYFVYITRAFATLEGIGLGIDPEFAIVKECWPYLAKRLLSDPSPRAEAALRSILYGAATSSVTTSSMADPGQFAELVGGFASYTATTSAPQGAQSNQVDPNTNDSLLIVEVSCCVQEIYHGQAVHMKSCMHAITCTVSLGCVC